MVVLSVEPKDRETGKASGYRSLPEPATPGRLRSQRPPNAAIRRKSFQTNALTTIPAPPRLASIVDFSNADPPGTPSTRAPCPGLHGPAIDTGNWVRSQRPTTDADRRKTKRPRRLSTIPGPRDRLRSAKNRAHEGNWVRGSCFPCRVGIAHRPSPCQCHGLKRWAVPTLLVWHMRGIG